MTATAEALLIGLSEAAATVAVDLTADGRITVAAACGTRATVLRRTFDGAPDTSFGERGTVFTAPADAGFTTLAPTGLAVGADGAPTVIATADDQVAVLRYTPDSALDPSFADRGIALAAPGADPSPVDVALTAAGGVVVAVNITVDGKPRIAVLRFTPAGAPDPAFGDRGIAFVELNEDAQAVAIDLHGDGAVVLAGTATRTTAAQPELLLAQFTPGGDPDPAFGSGGVALHQPAGTLATGLAMSLDGGRNIVLAGTSKDRFLAARYTSTGEPDPSFGDRGAATGVLLTDAAATTVGVRADGSAVVAGTTGSGWAAVRFTPDGSPDTGFGNRGAAVGSFTGGTGTAADQVAGIVLSAAGDIVIAGTATDRIALVSLTANGAPSPVFGRSGHRRPLQPGCREQG
ncbi:hypothetical protein [Streptomyces sp. NPDC101455]|uniref:hypothetical protein n=1 Tax=Streptomyces sp. NPDC101455 TaxID=3366142 RepID=UPI003819A289